MSDMPLAVRDESPLPSVRREDPTLPVFYRKPWPVSPERHGRQSLRPVKDYRFARGAGNVPLTLSEFALASRHYPIVFTLGPEPGAVAVLGVNSDENLFVDAAGRWLEGCYVPAYVRRYPFIFQEHPNGTSLTLAIDEACGLLEEGDSRPLYRGKEPSGILEHALKFTVEYQKDWVATRRFAQILKQAGLFSPHRAHLISEQGDVLEVAGFQIVAEESWSKAPDELVVTLRRHGLLSALHAHFFSAHNWKGLVGRSGRKRRRKSA